MVVHEIASAALGRVDSARYLGGITTRKLDELAAAGQIRRAKIGTRTVFLRSELDRYLESCIEPQ